MVPAERADRAAVALEDVARFVRRAVVDDDDLDLRAPLAESAVYGLPEEPSVLVAGNDDAGAGRSNRPHSRCLLLSRRAGRSHSDGEPLSAWGMTLKNHTGAPAARHGSFE